MFLGQKSVVFQDQKSKALAQDTFDLIVVGGGAASVFLLQALRDVVKSPLKILLINKQSLAKGQSLFGDSPYLAMSNPSVELSLFSEEPKHFESWLKEHPDPENHLSDLPRSKTVRRAHYGLYLEQHLQGLIAEDNLMDIQTIGDEVLALSNIANGWAVPCASGQTYVAKRLILAVGTLAPMSFPWVDQQYFDNDRFIMNPWVKLDYKALNQQARITIIGGGLTMADRVLDLIANGYKGNINVISKMGVLPLAQTTQDVVDEDNITLDFNLPMSEVFAKMRRLISEQQERNLPWQNTVDQISSLIALHWQNMPAYHKKQFIEHIMDYWNRLSYRLHPENLARLEQLQAASGLHLIRGHVQSIQEHNKELNVVCFDRAKLEPFSVMSDVVINATGPAKRLNRAKDPLIEYLLAHGYIQCDNQYLGIKTHADLSACSQFAPVRNKLFVLGALNKPHFFRADQIPSLREQSELLAKRLLG